MHLTEEQFESALAGERFDHLRDCPQCRQRLDELQALRHRLAAAFSGVAAGDDLRQRLLAAAQQRRAAAPTAPARRPFYLRPWATLSAAAAILLLAALPTIVYFSSTEPALAAPELVEVHQMNLADSTNFYSQDDPAKLADYFRQHLGFVPAMPRLDQGLALRGCCRAHFGGQIKGSYMVDTPSGPISIIVSARPPKSLGPMQQLQFEGRTYWTGSFGHCNLAVFRLGDLTYAAVGNSNVPHEKLVDLLGRLVK